MDAEIAVKLREDFYDGASVTSLSELYGLKAVEVNQLLDGELEPCAGGPLRPLLLQGCNPKFQESTRNRQRFVRGVIKLAYAVLTPVEFEIFSNSNGMRAKDAKAYAGNLEDLDERLAQERYRSVIFRHAAGTSLEESVIAHSKSARKSPAKTGNDR